MAKACGASSFLVTSAICFYDVLCVFLIFCLSLFPLRHIFRPVSRLLVSCLSLIMRIMNHGKLLLSSDLSWSPWQGDRQQAPSLREQTLPLGGSGTRACCKLSFT